MNESKIDLLSAFAITAHLMAQDFVFRAAEVEPAAYIAMGRELHADITKLWLVYRRRFEHENGEMDPQAYRYGQLCLWMCRERCLCEALGVSSWRGVSKKLKMLEDPEERPFISKSDDVPWYCLYFN